MLMGLSNDKLIKMTQYLPPNLLALFAPRDPIPYLPPSDKLPHEKKTRGYLGVGNFLGFFEVSAFSPTNYNMSFIETTITKQKDPKDTPPPTRVETREERLERRRREKAEQVAYKLEREIAIWDPTQLKSSTEDPFKTLFVSRINYDTSESKLRREFEVYGTIKKIIVIQNAETGKPRGYAFIEYEHERDMHSAYKHADGKKIDGKRVLVDVERARTVKGWLPRRLGGGLGGTRRGGPDVNIKHSGREDNERERERYRLEREREDRNGPISGGGAMDRRGDFRDRGDRKLKTDKICMRNCNILVQTGFNDRRRSRSPRIDRRERERSKHRSRSRDRKKRRSRDRGDRGDVDDMDRRRDRSDREKDKKRKNRSRSRDRSERKRDRRDRERDKDRKDRKPELSERDIKIKEEPVDDYPDYSENFANYGVQVKYEDGEEKFKPSEDDRLRERENGQNYGHEEGEYDDRDYN
ncbi:U1 small nuclear ribonucleoprotein 70 kDa [Pseudolycoriella hygida]|uniref:U1 small nuclear ribonucleoprotein 70 kDa n=1 Tax=Pseudolycoriella hygida TaxID=35572 RepID=A0A9Q0MUV8_9DIPT|nr:U1 small nuclear ribonucleoprotein 70 kDa [Pseudolycoriella hygida]